MPPREKNSAAQIHNGREDSRGSITSEPEFVHNKLAQLTREVDEWKTKCEKLQSENLKLTQMARDDARDSNAQILALVTSLNRSISQKDELIHELRTSQRTPDETPSAADVAHRANTVIEGLRADLATAKKDLALLSDKLRDQERAASRDMAQDESVRMKVLKEQLADNDLVIRRLQSKTSTIEQTNIERLAELRTREETLRAKDTEIARLTSLRAEAIKILQNERQRHEHTKKVLSQARVSIQESSRTISELQESLAQHNEAIKSPQVPNVDTATTPSKITNVSDESASKDVGPVVPTGSPNGIPTAQDVDSHPEHISLVIGSLLNPGASSARPSSANGSGPASVQTSPKVSPVATHHLVGTPTISVNYQDTTAFQIVSDCPTDPVSSLKRKASQLSGASLPNDKIARLGSLPGLNIRTFELDQPLPSLELRAQAPDSFYLCPMRCCGLSFELEGTLTWRLEHMKNDHTFGDSVRWESHVLPRAMLESSMAPDSRFYCHYKTCNESANLPDLADLRRHARSHTKNLCVARDLNEHATFLSRWPPQIVANLAIISPVPLPGVTLPSPASGPGLNATGRPQLALSLDAGIDGDDEIRTQAGQGGGLKPHRRKSVMEKKILAAAWAINQNPDKLERQRIAQRMVEENCPGLDEQQISSWFVNKRKMGHDRPTDLNNESQCTDSCPQGGASDSKPKEQVSNKELARPGAAQGADGLERLTELIFLALQSADESGQTSKNATITSLLELDYIASPQPLSSEQLAELHALIREKFPHIAPWQVKAWEHAVRRFATGLGPESPGPGTKQAVIGSPSILSKGDYALEALYRRTRSPTESELKDLIANLSTSGIGLSLQDAMAWFKERQEASKQTSVSLSGRKLSSMMETDSIPEFHHKAPENTSLKQSHPSTESQKSSELQTSPRHFSNTLLTCVECGGQGEEVHLPLSEYFRHHEIEHDSKKLRCPVCPKLKIRRFSMQGLYDHIQRHEEIGSIDSTWPQYTFTHKIGPHFMENDQSRPSSATNTAKHQDAACDDKLLPNALTSVDAIQEHFGMTEEETGLSRNRRSDKLEHTDEDKSSEEISVSAPISCDAPGDHCKSVPDSPGRDGPAVISDVVANTPIVQPNGQPNDTNSADVKSSLDKSGKPLIKQSNRCTACIEGKKYCNGEPVCEQCKTYYMGYGLPERYCVYPFILKDKNVKKITPADYVTLPASAVPTEQALLRPASVGRFWRPSTVDDFPELPKADIHIRAASPLVEATSLSRPSRTKRGSTFAQDHPSSNDEAEAINTDRHKAGQHKSIRLSTPTSSRVTRKRTVTPASTPHNSPWKPQCSISVAQHSDDDTEVQPSDAVQQSSGHDISHSSATIATRVKQEEEFSGKAAIAEPSLREDHKTETNDLDPGNELTTNSQGAQNCINHEQVYQKVEQ